ncbi:MAG: PTS transporter subunit EIIA [Dorea sp.]|nr:PTS transporter subunit EIIA [Dorea sp.]
MDLMLIRIMKELLELYNYITTEELAERIGISLSSVRHRMGRVKEAFREYGIAIEHVPRKGIKLKASESERNHMYRHMQDVAYSTPETKEYRKEYILKTLFEYSDNYTVQLFAEDLFVSKKIISRDLAEVEKFLAGYQVKLMIRRNSGILMKGNEFDVRQAMISHYNSLWWYKRYDEKPDAVDPRISKRAWTYMNEMYGDLDLVNLQRQLLLAEQELGLTWTDIAFSRLLEYLVITKRRIQKNWMIENVQSRMLLPVEDAYIQAAGRLLWQAAGKDQAAQEIQYLAARIYVAGTVWPRESENSERFRLCAVRYLGQVGEVLNRRDLGENEGLVQKLCEMLSVIQYKENYHITDWTDSNREVKKNMSVLYGICLLQTHVLEEGTGLTLSQDDLAQIAVCIKNYMQKSRKEAIFVTAADTESADYQLEKLKKRFPELHFTGAVHYQKFQSESCRDRLIISSVDLKQKNANIYKITKHVNNEDLAKLEEELKRNQGSSRNWRELIAGNLAWEVNAKDKADAISQICSVLMEKGYVSADFEEKLLQREVLTPTTIGNRTAVPHVFDEHVRKEFIAVIRLRHRILWDGKEQADLLLVMAASPGRILDASGFLLDCKELYSRDGKIFK